MNLELPQDLGRRPARERILLTACRLFYRDGVRATGVDRVIRESGVAKLTFYRHFPSKNDLVRAFLEYRHEAWMGEFRAALRAHGSGPGALVPALEGWLCGPGFRGCAFLNSVGELGGELPEVSCITRRHKQDMTGAIEALFPATEPGRADKALALSLAVDGAILRAQYDGHPGQALRALALSLAAVTGTDIPGPGGVTPYRDDT